MKGGRPDLGLRDYRRSAAARQHARATIKAFNAVRHLHPKCSAIAKHSGERCGHLAMKNGKCRYHGGATPTGKDWHRTSPINPARPDGGKRAERKIHDAVKHAERRAKRRAAMSPERRAEHELWQRTYKPGSKEARAAEKERRRRDREAAAGLRRISADAAPVSAYPEQAELDRLYRLRDARRDAARAVPPADYDVFS